MSNRQRKLLKRRKQQKKNMERKNMHNTAPEAHKLAVASCECNHTPYSHFNGGYLAYTDEWLVKLCPTCYNMLLCHRQAPIYYVPLPHPIRQMNESNGTAAFELMVKITKACEKAGDNVLTDVDFLPKTLEEWKEAGLADIEQPA